MKRGPKPKRKEVVWSAEIAYVVGLMATDGCLSSDGRHLTLVSKDIEQLKNAKRCLKLATKIKPHFGGSKGNTTEKYYRLQWSDVTLYDFFVDIGLTPRKSLTIGALSVPDEYFFDFLRGSYDGDGSFYSYFDPRWKSSFMFYLCFTSASNEHILWLRETINRLSGLKGHMTQTGKKCVMSNLKYAKEETLALLSLIYSSPVNVSLSRKRLKISRALGIVGITLSNLDGSR